MQTRVRVNATLRDERVPIPVSNYHAMIQTIALNAQSTAADTCRGYDGLPKGLAGTSCCPGDDHWLGLMAQADPTLTHKAFMIVGCNTGVDAVRFLQMWGNKQGVMGQWKRELNGVLKGHGGACGQNALASADDAPPKAYLSTSKVFCVEPGPSNVKVLEQAKTAVFGEGGPFTVLAVAGSDAEGTAFFPDLPPGSLDGEVGQINKKWHNAPQKEVRVTTVDQLVSENNLTGLDGLVIDAECFDPAVLAGAKETLRTARYLMWEESQGSVNGDIGCLPDTPSAQVRLHTLLGMVDAHGFDCYWAGNGAKVQRLTGCWNSELEDQHFPLQWTNVVCVRRGDVWHDIFAKLDTGLSAPA